MDTAVKYHIEVIKNEARLLISKGFVNRQQPIYALCRYIPERDWPFFELELEKNEFLLRDRLIDLLSKDKWEDD